nr:C-type lectin domain family 10 member A-like isoform X1 [Equus caballus]
MWSDYGTSLVLGLPIGNTGEQQCLSLCGACREEPRRQSVSSACSVWHRAGLIIFALIVPSTSSDSTFQRDLVTLNNSTSQTELQVKSLISQGDSLQKTITPLKAGVGNLRQELQAARSMNDKVFSLEKKLEEEQQTLKADYAEIRLLVQQLAKDLTALTCQAAALKSNGSARACCPLNWLEHEGSCYWFSRSKKPWPEAEKQCQLQNAHLVVINSREEQDFVQEHIGSSDTWMGLSDPTGVWKWVDGTDYKTNFQNWSPGQPDDWDGHGLGPGEDCVHFNPDGTWNDNACQRPFHWVCETKMDKAS